MKNLIVSVIVAIVAFASVRTASAEVTIEVRKDVMEVTIKDTRAASGYSKTFTFSQPTKTLIKPCVDRPASDCLYEVSRGGTERKLYAYKAHELMMVVYTTREPVAISRR